jgi:hypothetical protein
MPVFFIGNGRYSLRIFIEFSTQINLQFNAEVAGGVSIENGVWFVIVTVDKGNVLEAVTAVRDILIITFIVGILIQNKTPASVTGYVVVSEATVAKGNIAVSFVIVFEDPLAAVDAECGQFLKAVFTVKILMEDELFSQA